jgi:hypothetical protein
MADGKTEAEALADVLRCAGSWLHLAAERIEAGDLAAAHNMARLGIFGCEDTPDRIDALHEQEVTANR